MDRSQQIIAIFILGCSGLLAGCNESSNDSKSNVETSKGAEEDTVDPKISKVFPSDNHGIQSTQVYLTGTVTDNQSLKEVQIIYNEQIINATILGDQFNVTLNAMPGENSYLVKAIDTTLNESEFQSSFYFGARSSAGGAHSGVISQGNIYAWGRNNKGQVGIGATTSISDDPEAAEVEHPATPVVIVKSNDNVALPNFVSLAFNQNASSALDDEGYVWSWGDGDDGQLGLGTLEGDEVDETDYLFPTKIENLNDIVSISRGYDHCLVLRNDGSVFAFGDNSKGQLGDGTTVDNDVPVLVSGLSNIVQISASVSSYALDDQGRVWAWGTNKYGQQGNGVENSELVVTPTQVPIDEPVVSLATGKGHVLALTVSGQVFAWGLNASSQVGLHESETWANYILTPTLLPWFDDAVAVWANGNQSFVQRADGKVYPWGQNMMGTLGIEQDDNVEQPESAIFGLENVSDLGNGALHTLAIRKDNQIFTWGWSFEGSLGGGESTIHRWSYRLPLALTLPE